MKRYAALTLFGLALAMGGCATTGGRVGPVDATRYHLGQPIAPGSFSVEPVSTDTVISPEYQMYADAVAGELSRLGFTRGAGTDSLYIAGVTFTRAPVGTFRSRAPVTIGIGGGTGGYGGGIGGGASFGIGGGRTQTVVMSELGVQLRRRSDNTVIWEGRARTESPETAMGAQPAEMAGRLAAALFKGFPGESGITITVP